MRAVFLVTLVLVGVVAAGPASGASVPIVNFSFEDPDPPPGDGGFTVGVATGWVATVASGVFDPTLPQLSQGPTDGFQVGYSNDTGLGLSQALAAVVTADTLYTLQVDVQARSDNVPSPGSTIQLRTLVQQDILATASVGPLAPGTNFLNLTAIFFANALDPNLGETLQIALISSGIQSDWDNVRLDATTTTTAVPEPSTLLLWATMAAGLSGVMWRRRHGRSSE